MVIYGPKSKGEFYVDSNDPSSIQGLKDAIYNDDFYDSEEHIVFHSEVCIKGRFASDIICDPCTVKIGYDIYCILAQAVAAERPFAIICPKCNTNYMEFMKE